VPYHARAAGGALRNCSMLQRVSSGGSGPRAAISDVPGHKACCAATEQHAIKLLLGLPASFKVKPSVQ
jgi:hypothetical protein